MREEITMNDMRNMCISCGGRNASQFIDKPDEPIKPRKHAYTDTTKPIHHQVKAIHDKTQVDDDNKVDECQTGYYFTFARNMMYCEEDGSKEKPWHSSHAQEIVKRVSLAIELGGVIYMWHPQEGAGWYVNLTHRDGTDEAIVSFRQRERALVFIAYVYLFALDKPRDCG